MSSFPHTLRRIEAALAREQELGAAFDSDRNRSRLAGQLVLAAAYIARKVIYQHLDLARQRVDLGLVVEDLALAKRAYDRAYPDCAGHGAAALHRIIQDLLDAKAADGKPHPK